MKISSLKWYLFLMLFLWKSVLCSQDVKISKEDSIKTIQLFNSGINSGVQGDFENAIYYFNELLELRRSIYGESSFRLAPILTNLGIQYKNLGNHQKAIEAYKQAEFLYLKKYGPDYTELGTVYINLGNIYGRSGDYNKALQYHKNALRILRKDSIIEHEAIQTSKYNIAEMQFKLGNYNAIIDFSKSSFSHVAVELKCCCFGLISKTYSNFGDFNFANKYYLLAIKSWISLYGNDNIELADEYLAYSSFLITQKKYDEALVYSDKAKVLALKFYGPKSRAYAEVQSNLGDYYYMKNSEARQIDEFRTQRKKYLNESIKFYQESIIALVDSFENRDPFINPELKNVVSEIGLIDKLKKKALALEKLADIYLSEFDYKKSQQYYSLSLDALIGATELIHRLQIGFENEDSRLFLVKNQESTFYEAIKIAHKLYQQTKSRKYVDIAFEFSEKSKSSTLLASVKDVKAKEFGGIPDSLLTKEKNLKSNIATYSSMLFSENHSANPETLKINLYSSKIFKYNDEYSKLIQSFEKSYPQYYSFKYQNKVIGTKEVQSRINSRQAVLEYFVREPDSHDQNGELYCFVITKDSIEFNLEKIDSTFNENIQSIHDFLTNPNYLYTTKKEFSDYAISGKCLYDRLLLPVLPSINRKELTIIPHDKLSYIPFDALITQMPDTSVMNFRNLDYLIKDYVVNYSYSATLMYDFSDRKRGTSNEVLIFSPDYNGNEARIDPETSRKYYLNPLPGAVEEVDGISKVVKSSIFKGNLAQENEFKSKVSDFDILHLAMHTIVNDSLPMFSKLVFSASTNSTANDGFLNTFEIYNMKINARLAVLSACETGSGKLQKGEGIMSLARGFIYAGCPAIVMTMWQIDDKSGAVIMKDFYNYLSKGKRKDIALRLAKLKHLESSDPLMAHPHYWLAYVSIGNAEPLYTSKDVYFILIVLLVAVLIGIDVYWRKNRNAKRSR